MSDQNNNELPGLEVDKLRESTSGRGKINPELLKNQHIKIKSKNRVFILGACHRIPSRSFIFRGKPLLCYRCLGIYGSFYIAALIYISYRVVILFNSRFLPFLDLKSHWDIISFNSFLLKLLYIILLLLPYIIDGVIQAKSKTYQSNNSVRFITGVLGGIGQFYFFITLGQFVKVLYQMF
jgi:uncharacterized membrane protein